MGSAQESRSSRPRGGFTLAELMVVVLILALVATLATLSWRAVLPRTELNSAVRRLAETIHGARSDAISRNAEFEIEYFLTETDEHPRGYRVITPFRAGGQGGLAAAEEERLARSFVTLPKTVTFRSITLNGNRQVEGKVSVRFDPLGAAADHIVVLEQPEYEKLYTIEVLALTGLVRFHDGEFSRPEPREQDFRR